MSKISFYSETESTWIELPTIDFTRADEDLSVINEMASGALTIEDKGYRPVITAKYSYLPNSVLVPLQKQSILGFISLRYPDIDGQEIEADFISAPILPTYCKTIDGLPVWCDIKLTFKAKEAVV